MNCQLHVVGRGVQRARARLDDAHRQIRLHMQAVHAVDVRIFHHAALHHRLRAAVRLLRRLKQQLHRARQTVAHAHEHLRRAQHHRHVRIVAAGVHHARMLRAEGQPLRLLKRQRVHVRAQRNHIARQRALDHADDPGALRRVRNAQLVQRLHDDLLRLDLRKAPLGYPVEPAADVHHPVLLRLHQRLQFTIVHL